MRERVFGQKGSGLIIALSVLAMLAIMATTFITLMRLDTRITANYVDDFRCEMLARGMVNYFKSLLADDLDRTWGKYENRDAYVGAINPYVSANWVRVPGLWESEYGTPVSNDFWLNPPYRGATDWGGMFLPSEYSSPNLFTWQQSFAVTAYRTDMIPAVYREVSTTGTGAPVNRDMLVWITRMDARWGPDGKTGVHKDYPGAGAPIDFDGDGVWTDDPYEKYTRYLYNDLAPAVLFEGDTYFYGGRNMTGEATLPGGTHWRWSVKLGVPHSMYHNLNTIGNLECSAGSNINNMGSIGLRARQCTDETDCMDTIQGKQIAVPSQHLGRIAWKGFSGEYNNDVQGGFPKYYNEVNWHPSQVSLEKLFWRGNFTGSYVNAPSPTDDWSLNLRIDRNKARKLVAYRLGNDGVAGGGDRYRVGWRRDGATYYRMPTPDCPQGDDRYYGASEVMEHDHAAGHPGTSAIIDLLATAAQEASPGLSLKDAAALAEQDWYRIKKYLTMWSTDTILRGKIWPTEGPLPWRTNASAGDWRHIDVLKRVNLNMIGAKGPEGLAGEDTALKTQWAAKAPRERDRLYFMLVAALRFTNTPSPQQNACQFIASLADMVDRDHDETYYAAPDGSGIWALGIEKHPVINEVVFYSAGGAATASYDLTSMRVELYNPMENIPWIKDTDEAYDVSNYMLRIGTTRNYRLGDMVRYGADPANPNGLYSDALPGNTNGAVRTIGADGLYGMPQANATTTHPTWTRYMHLGWPGGGFPAGLTRGELEGTALSGVEISLWKRLPPEAMTWPALATDIPGRVETINGAKHLCVDRTPLVQLVRPYGPANSKINGPGGNQAAYVGIYRRWDPMNAKIYGTQTVMPGTGDVCDQRGNVLWVPGKTLATYPTLGKPNTGYVDLPDQNSSGYYITYSNAPGAYLRAFERNFKLVDGDLPTIGWLGEMMMWNCAQNGPLTWVHTNGQNPSETTGGRHDTAWQSTNMLDLVPKFDLYRPFCPAGWYQPDTRNCKTANLAMLDIFTVWDPSNDGMDNDGDGAVDDADTGYQTGDRCGPEVRVFGGIDLNQGQFLTPLICFADNPLVRNQYCNGPRYFCEKLQRDWDAPRAPDDGTTWCRYMFGPFETIGDCLRADWLRLGPGSQLAGNAWDPTGPGILGERGCGWDAVGMGDDDGDGIKDERDERDMLFTWVANHFTTRCNVFELDLNVDICKPPYYPQVSGSPRKLPFRVCKTLQVFAKKQTLAILDRSTCLRVAPDGRCDFSGPVDIRMLRFTEDKRSY